MDDPDMRIVFCHGFPGSTADADFLRAANPDAVIHAMTPFGADAPDWEAAVLAKFDAQVAKAGKKRVHLIGFSIGAMIAIKIAAERPQDVAQLTLVSAAAPLQSGDFLPDMAGRPVFELAMKRPRVLRALSAAQGLVARFAPALLIKALFAKCGEGERALLKDVSVRRSITKGLRSSLSTHRDRYLAVFQSYVSDWRGDARDIKCPVTLWQGAADTWSPPEMAAALADLIGPRATVHVVAKGEHYSTLTAVRLAT